MTQGKYHIHMPASRVLEIFSLPEGARNDLLQDIFKQMIAIEAYKFSVKYPSIPIQDLINIGNNGLYRSLTTYVVGKGNLVSYVWNYIHGHLANYCFKEGKHLSRYTSYNSVIPTGDVELLITDTDDTLQQSAYLKDDIAYILTQMKISLTDEEFKVLTWLYIEGWTHKVVSGLLHKSIKQVKLIGDGALLKVRSHVNKEDYHA
jgi:DNA-directed RNA polymerase specialized sigma subunit